MAPQPDAVLRDRSPTDSPSYALRADLADRLARHRRATRDGGQSPEPMSTTLGRPIAIPLWPEGATPDVAA
jgi:hypothetical protein